MRLANHRFLSVVMAALTWFPTMAVSAPVETARVGKVRISGNVNIKTYIIRRQISLRTGDPFEERELVESRHRIRRVPGVDYCDLRVVSSPADSTLGVSVFVTEKSTLDGQPIVQRGRENDMSFGLRVSERNFRGRSETLSASVVVRGNETFFAAWENPWIGNGPRIGLGVTAHVERYDYVYDDAGAGLLGAGVRRYGAEFSIFRPFAARSRVFLAAGGERVEGDAAGVTIDPGGDLYAAISLGVDYDGRDSGRFPWSGTRLRAEGREVGPLGDSGFLSEAIVDAGAYASPFGRSVLATGVRVVYRDGGSIPPYRREHIGGSQTLRGYDFGSFHGTRSIVAGVEYRLPLNFSRARPVEDLLLGVSAHVFADAGAAWDDEQKLSRDIFKGTYGLGIIVLNGSVPGLRIDYGWQPRSSGRWEIGVGAKL